MIVQIPYRPFDYQLKFHKDESRFRLVVGGRRVGKTLGCVQDAVKHCLSTTNGLCWWIAPTYREAQEVGWTEFLALSEHIKDAIFSIHHTQLKVQFINGSKMYFKGSDNPDTLRGRGLTYLVADEYAFCKDVWGKILRPALSDRQGRATLISTPNGLNHFHTLFKASNDWSKYVWKTELNPTITKEELESVRAEISDIDFRQEYLAEFITKQGRVYSDFNDDNVIPTWTPSQDWDIYLGMDFGFAHKTAICFMAVENKTFNKVVQFDEIYVDRVQMSDVVQLMYSKLSSYGLGRPIAIYTDPSGNAEELVAGISPVDVMRMEPHNLNVVNKGTNVNPGLAMVRSWICSGTGKRRYYVTQNCVETIRSFNGYQYAQGKFGRTKEEPDKDNIHDDMCDAIRYFFVNKFDNAKYVASSPTQEDYGKTLRPKRMQKCGLCHKPFITSDVGPGYICDKCKDERDRI